jgi:hypothetical protein
MLTPRLRAFLGRLASRPSATVELADVAAIALGSIKVLKRFKSRQL